MESLRQDLRVALRALARQPAMTFFVVLTLAVGIGATTAVFSVVNGVLLRPLPYADADRLLLLYQKNARSGEERLPQSYANYLDVKEQSQAFATLGAYYGVSLNLTGAGEPERLIGTAATASLFEVLGVAPQLGTVFTEAAEEPGNGQVVVLSYALWQRRFGGDAGVLGQRISLSDNSRQIIGVMPAGFRFPHKDAEFWVPLAVDARQRQARGAASWFVIGRLREADGLTAARREVEAIAANLRRLYPEALSSYEVTLLPLAEQMTGSLRPALLLLLATAGFVLLIACVNIANLLLARAATREKEIAIRLAVGAGRGRVVRQLLTESLLLASLGGAAGLLFAVIGLRLLLSLSPAGLQGFEYAGDQLSEQMTIDGRVLFFTFGVTLATGVLFGIVPALQSSKPDLHSVLKDGGRRQLTRGARRWRSLLLIGEVALSLMLLIGAGLMIKSFLRLQAVELGFTPERLVMMNLQLPRAMWRDPVQSELFFKQLIERIEALPDVEAAGAISALFINGQAGGSKFIVEGSPLVADGEQLEAQIDMVSHGFFRVLGTRLLEGREFTAAEDTAKAERVVIINQTFARRCWYGASPIGKRVKFAAASAAGEAPWYTVIGVVEDMRRAGADTAPRLEAFWSHSQSPMGFMTVVTRTTGEPLAMAQTLHGVVWSLNPEQPISHTTTATRLLDELSGARRLQTLLFAVFAAVAVGLAAAGIYGVMSYSVAQRTHEIGVRMALGASPPQVLRQFVAEGMRRVAAGVALGVLAAYATTRGLASLLFEVSETDAMVFVLTPLLLAAVALVAALLPARRATKVDPLVALRHE